MKNLLLITALLASASSFATSIRSTKLRLEVLPAFRSVSTAMKAKYVNVLADGEVMGSVCDVRGNRLTQPRVFNCENYTLDRLSPRELRKLDRMIAIAALGEIQNPNPGGLHCLAMPINSKKYDANNGRVFLKAGTYPCGGQSLNLSPVAAKLVEELDAYMAELNQVSR